MTESKEITTLESIDNGIENKLGRTNSSAFRSTTGRSESKSRPSPTSSFILAIISWILVIIILIVCIGIIWRDLFPPDPNSRCPKYFCATNIYSGIKRCPIGDELITPDLSIEVCNDPDGCTNGRTPCVYGSENRGTSCPGDFGYTGICENDYCRCLDRIVCPDWATVYFESNNVYSGTTNLYNVLVQLDAWKKPSGIITTEIPLSPGQYTVSAAICGISQDRIIDIWPPDQCLNGNLGKNKEDGKWYCMKTNLQCPEDMFLMRDTNGQYICEFLDLL